MKPQKLHFPFYYIILIIISFHCAGMNSPSGGPRDTTPPTILETFPQQNTLQFSEKHFSLSFNEWMNKQSVENALFISPSLGKLEFNWSGEDVDVEFSNALNENTTYVITVGTDASDNHGIKLKESFSLAFSTGIAIDSGKISGKVFDEKASGVMIFAYSNRHHSFDTLSPSTISPDYISQTGNDGTFTLDHLAEGTYRIFAVRDEERNLLFDVESNEIGIARNDVALNDSINEIHDVNFRLSKIDETKPFLLSAKNISLNEIELSFSEVIDMSKLSEAKIQIINTNKRELVIKNIFPEIPSQKKLFLETQEQDSNEHYFVTVTNVFDTSGNGINEAQNTISFISTSISDTIPPSIISLTPIFVDSIRGIELQPNILCIFSESINEEKIENAFLFQDSSKNNISFELNIITQRTISISPRQKLQSDSWFVFSIMLDSVEDKYGLHLKDSMLVRHFRTTNENEIGILKGKIAMERNEKNNSRYFVSAKNIERKNFVQQVEANEKKEFEFNNLVQGKYVLSAFRDDDENKKYSYGKTFPFSTAEIFTESSDTLKVRARWSVEGIQLKIRN
ncbi:MAG: hypothetical protein FJ218_02410 [Ignavibacteria bacterium]|nr:hypothetical protein [Ignavibacteria bacterium]